METLTLKINNPETVLAISEAARGQRTTPELYALELLETVLLAKRPFEEIVEPIASSFDKSGMNEEEFDSLIEQAQQAIRAEKRQRR